jgi:CarD family transcriptional regulator
VVYPAHGIAEVIGREELPVDGASVTHLVLAIPQHDWGTSGVLKVLVPEHRADGLGVRRAVSSEEATEILEVLAATDVRVPTNWSRRFKNHQEKLKTGDIYQCAEVVRNLAVRQERSALAAAERTMYRRARHTLIGELAVSWGVPVDEAEERVDHTLALATSGQ